MGMTMTQKILAKHAGLDRVEVGQLIEARVDMVLGNDITTPVAITEFEKAGLTKTKFPLCWITTRPVRTSSRRSCA